MNEELNLQMVQNTAVAFSSKSSKELKKSYRIFSLMNRPYLSRAGTFLARIAQSLGIPLKPFIKPVYDHFCGGENLSETGRVVKELNDYNIKTILDYAVEAGSGNKNVVQVKEQMLRTLNFAADHSSIPHISMKLTGIIPVDILIKVQADQKLSGAEEKELQRTKDIVEEICKAAVTTKTGVYIDAEESWIQDPIDELAIRLMEKYNKERVVVLNTLQLYRTDRLEFLKKSFDRAREKNYILGMKLVRGAYMEKERKRAEEKDYPSPIQPDKEATDRDFDEAVRFCLANYKKMAFCVATHNEKSSVLLATEMEKENIPKNHPHIFFAQLYGMSDHISYNLSAKGFNVAKYLPYGPVSEVIPYLLRRAEENTSIAGQAGRELKLVKEELERRGKKSLKFNV